MTIALVERLIPANPVREQGSRSARGVQRVGEKYGALRTELECERALRFGSVVQAGRQHPLALGRESAPLPEDEEERLAIQQENVRGPDYEINSEVRCARLLQNDARQLADHDLG